MGQIPWKIGELQVKILWGNTMLLGHGSVGVAGYDLCVAGCCVIHSWVKDAMNAALAVSLPMGTYIWIAPRLGLAIQN